MILGTGQKYVIKQGYGNFSDQKWPGDNCQQCLHLTASLGISINIFSVKGFLWAKSHIGPDYTLARDVWHLTLWTERHFGSAQLGPLHFGPSTLWLKTFWLVTFWLLTFGTKWHIGLSRFGLGQFGPVMLWTVTFWTSESWPKTNWTRRHFGPRHFGSRHFGPRTFRPKTFQPKTFRPLVNYIYSTMLYMSRVFNEQ